ncbi:unknown [Cryptophlebia leucotreta granulovirus]|uniref:Uncharacterized protein n=1 Tax=Cryptophlebia leucotreta granulosis virus TaxID=35254 RepID=Q7T5Q2_GVCL|nr:hypothetical protein [Cryptophlebia leucotreta granulovirus]AAQ21632.1 unknown [Cryptophlebia leucotreta granulovirus]AUF82059.1 hypothetical protein [Cryptophlebia leucotreta granulovirus]
MSPKIITCYIIISDDERYIDKVLDGLSVICAKYDDTQCYVISVDCVNYSKYNSLINQSFMMSQRYGSIHQLEDSGQRFSFKSFAEAVKWFNGCNGIEYRSCFMDVNYLK